MSENKIITDIRFSIIVPIYNTEKYLNKCIDSILKQTYSNFELILVDDGSTDSSGEICDDYAKKYDFIKVIHQENLGVSVARNVGLDVARYEWISFVDSDDWVESEVLEILSKHIVDENADIYSFNMNVSNESGSLVRTCIFNKENRIFIFENENERFNYFYNILVQGKAGQTVWERVFRKDIIEKNNLRFISRDIVSAEDQAFVFQYMLYVNKISALSDIFYNYRVRKGSLTNIVDRNLLLSKLYNFAVIGYNNAEKQGMKYFCNQFYKLYFVLLENRVSYLLANEAFVEVHKKLKAIRNFPLHKKWCRQIDLMLFRDIKLFWGLIKKYIKKLLRN